MKRKPESSLLHIISYEEDSSEQLLLAYLKQLDDINPPSEWHWKFGKKGFQWIWEEKKLKQWLVYGNDQKVEQLLIKIEQKEKLNINGKQIEFGFNDENSKGIEHIDGKECKQFSDDKPPQYLQEEHNTLLIEGYKKEDKKIINPIAPPGLFPKMFLHNSITSGYKIIRDKRNVHYHFKGKSESSNGDDVTKMIGFVQGRFNDSDYRAVFKNEEGEVIAESVVDKYTGYFSIPLSHSSYKGAFTLVENKQVIEDKAYTLLRNIKVTSSIADGVFKDAYGREKLLLGKKKIKRVKPKPNTWQKELFSSVQEQQISLSDYIQSLLNYLGPNIFIADPYFLGKIPPDTENEKKSHEVFINAVLSAAVLHGIDNFKLMGYWGSAKKIINECNEEKVMEGTNQEGKTKRDKYFSDLKAVISRVIKQNNLTSYLKLNKVEIINAHRYFHNRYWVGINKKNGKWIINKKKVFLVTNSINGVFKAGEIDFMPVTDSLQISRIAERYNSLLNELSEKYNLGKDGLFS